MLAFEGVEQRVERDQPLLQPPHLIRRTVARHRDQLAALVQGVEGVKEFRRRDLSLDQELDVVHQEDIGTAVLAPEFALSSIADGLDEIAEELLRRHIGHLLRRALGQRVLSDSL